MREFIQALRTECVKKPIECLTLATTVFALVAAFISVYFAFVSVNYVEKQLVGIADALESQAYNYIDNNQIELDKVFVSNPEYRMYFYNNEPFPELSKNTPLSELDEKTKEKLQTLSTLADLKLDIIDSFYTQAEHINWSRYSRNAWDEFYNDSFARSEVMCRAICKDWNEYGKDIRKMAIGPKACDKKIKPRDPNDASKGCDWVP